MSKIKEFLYPALQRLRHAGFQLEYRRACSLPMDKKRILMYSSSKGRLGGNLLAVKEYLEKNGAGFTVKAITAPDGVSKKQLAREMAQSGFILVDDYEPLVYVLRLRSGQRLVQVWHALGAFKRFGYGRASAVKSSITHKNYTDAIVSSADIVKIYAEAFGIDRSRVKAVGSPRTDRFFDPSAVSAARERLYGEYPGLRGKRICLFAPTFRGENVNDAHYPARFFDVGRFMDNMPDDWALIIKMHPFVKDSFAVPAQYSHRVFDLSKEQEINDILFITDVLVTDYSSVIFENAVIGNPAVLYAPDLDEYGGARGFYYDYSDYACGDVVRDFSSLAQAVLNARRSDERLEAFKARFVSLCDGRSCERFVKEVLKK